MARKFFFACLLALVASSLSAQLCEEGVVYDDGEFSTFAGWLPTTLRGEYAMLFDPGHYPVKLNEVCICWQASSNDRVDFDLRLWDASGPNRAPGTLIGELPGFSSSGLPSFVQWRFDSYDVSANNLVLTGPTYIGPSWFPGDGFDVNLCVETSATTPRQPGYGGLMASPGEVPGIELGTDFIDNYRALGIRAVFEPIETDCIPSDTALCLLGDRFRVEVDWSTFQGDSGQGQGVELTPDAGYFWFFNQNNVEIVVKMRDACVDPFNRFWVFAGGLTNVEVTMTVTDTETGAVQTYHNPQGTPFQPITDTDAFATCP